MFFSHNILLIAERAVCSERTVRRYLADPDRVNGFSRIRIERAMRELGLTRPAA